MTIRIEIRCEKCDHYIMSVEKSMILNIDVTRTCACGHRHYIRIKEVDE